jgi:hypothetical protein|nr:MAG TPA: TERMINASE SMALL SUBUNIT [Caudoviricetes sp.]
MSRRKPGRPKARPLTHKQEVYVQAKILTGSRKEALKVAGYTDNANQVESSKAVQKALEDYRRKMDQKFMDKADQVANILLDIIENPDTPSKTKVTAIKDWLDRAGLKPVDKQEVDDKRVIDTSSRLSRDLIDKLNMLPKEKGEE